MYPGTFKSSIHSITRQEDPVLTLNGRLFPYMAVTGALGVFFIFLVLGLIARHLLLPGILILGSFILFILWLTGLIETSLQLYGVTGNVNDNCQIYVVENQSRGDSIDTLAWLTQSTICECSPHLPIYTIYTIVVVAMAMAMAMTNEEQRLTDGL